MKIAISGSGGNIGYNLLFRLFTDLFTDKHLQLQIFCLEIPECWSYMESIIKEIEDCNFLQIKSIKACTALDFCLCELDAFIILSSAKKAPSEPRDVLLSRNYEIFNSIFTNNLNPSHDHQDTINKKFPYLLIISNPANSMAWTTSKLLPFIPTEQIFSLSQLDHKRALILFSNKIKCSLQNVNNLFILGNHSKTAVPVISFVTVNGIKFNKILNSENLKSVKEWLKNEFNNQVRERNYEMVKYRGFGSCCSVVTAIIDNLNSILNGNEGKISTMGMVVDINKKGIKINDLCVSIPVIMKRNIKNELIIYINDKIYKIDENDKLEFLKSLNELENEKNFIQKIINEHKK